MEEASCELFEQNMTRGGCDRSGSERKCPPRGLVRPDPPFAHPCHEVKVNGVGVSSFIEM